MEFLFIGLLLLVPLAFTVMGIALIVNAIESIRETKDKYGRKR